jgi:hypothetical protein
MSHVVREGEGPVKRATALGGVFSLIGASVIATYALYMILQYLDANTLVQRSLGAVNGGTWAAAGALPWASAALPGAPAAKGLLLRLTVDGETGACSAPLAPFSFSGLLAGVWALTSTRNCGGSGVAQHTFTCAGCELGPAASLSFQLHFSCQSLLLEAAGIPAYPAGASSLVTASGAAVPGQPLTSLAWRLSPLLTLVHDNVTAGRASARGYAFAQSTLEVARTTLPAAGAATSGDSLPPLFVQPLAAAVNITFFLPLNPT